MSIIITILIGAFVGWVASSLLGRDEGFVMSTVIGIIGAFIGSFISVVTTGSNHAYLGFSLSGILWSVGGALVFVAILNLFSRPRRRNRNVV